MTADGNKFIENHVDEGLQGMEMKIVRWLEGGKMIVVSSTESYSVKTTTITIVIMMISYRG